MVAESAAILAICGIMLVVFLRSKYKKSAIAVLPVAVIPAVHLLFSGILALRHSGAFFGVSTLLIQAFIDLMALCITCALIILLGNRIKVKKLRNLYITIMLVYSIIIGWCYIYFSLHLYFFR